MYPLITVVTPSYNQGRFLKATIESVLSQDYKNIEYIINDGGSRDNTISILQKYGSQINWVSERDLGQADAVNKGLRQAKGEIIGWLNSDDVYSPNAITKVMDFFQNHPDVDVVYGKTMNIDFCGQPIDYYPVRKKWNMQKLQEDCFISQPATFFRKSVIKRYGLLDQNLQFCMDYEYWLRLGKLGAKFAFLDEVLACARIYPETKSLGKTLEHHKEAVEMISNHFGNVPLLWRFNYASAKVKTKQRNNYIHNNVLVLKQLWSDHKHTQWIKRSITFLQILLLVLKRQLIKLSNKLFKTIEASR